MLREYVPVARPILKTTMIFRFTGRRLMGIVIAIVVNAE